MPKPIQVWDDNTDDFCENFIIEKCKGKPVEIYRDYRDFENGIRASNLRIV